MNYFGFGNTAMIQTRQDTINETTSTAAAALVKWSPITRNTASA